MHCRSPAHANALADAGIQAIARHHIRLSQKPARPPGDNLRAIACLVRIPLDAPLGDATAILAGVHPIVEKLMEAAGMPHVHPNADQEPKP